MCTRVIRWKLRGWLSCISACKVSLDDEQETERKMRVMGFGSIEECRGNKMVNRKSWWRRKNGRQIKINSENETQGRNDASIMVSKSSDSSSWSGFNHAQDEEYIVFCFREDGAFDVVKDGMSESLDCFGSKHVSPGVATPEFYYDEVAETVEESNHEITPNIAVTSNDQETIPVEHEETKLDIEPPYTSETVRHEVEGTVNGGMVSVESSDSNQSFGSTGSFSFPVLQRDFMGSPVQMPKSESLQLRKDRISCGRFQCWRF
ncbi:hypothetical protein K2173_027392 [Erythroxylum novogranatense]|uniref:Uncharacterized protein n=1 Tax=Erythroxylum novogranatense TaxID=1862640 RepID=A0AAV8U2E3_9ROSI|nr:hypothetical protein K2173_027392 [Erythroxylum novogranatense]